MLIIFLFSSRSADEMPHFGSWEYVVKKSSHAIVYGLLAISYLYAMPKQNYFMAWLWALLYSITDEFHQSFVPGRNSSLIDVFVFDNIGAMVALWIYKTRHNVFPKGID
jgi:VanZ family protein